MTPKEFKLKWIPNRLTNWWQFDLDELMKLPISITTRNWLKNGFPEDAAPFLSFGLRSYNGVFHSITNYYTDYYLDSKMNQYWIFGSDGAGNPICIDSANNDRILLLDHEQEFEILYVMNQNISDLAHCMLELKIFIENIQSELGTDAYIDSKFEMSHVLKLKNKIQKRSDGKSVNSEFWDSEIENMLNVI